MTTGQASTTDAPRNLFAAAVEAAEHLELRRGLQAVKRGEGRGKIVAADPRRILGSVAIDDDCNVQPYQQANRWDYAIGYARASEPVVYFVEIHSATPAEVKVVARKWQWLREFLHLSPQAKLRRLPSEFFWLASSGMRIHRHLPQYRHLAVLKKRGLRFCTGRLDLT